ncbi:hypothetical protein CgunFtcFv8_011174 [Champsocephalus gunnari]|uniref:Uncharacterized protein n=1 Tax=Champsocephalus gunnari TaxID=52237 RepID=A0AAN8DWH0_CHAGU|nr:hypothetical protein CgunFtcFv8_011174 [Champsocephalus gunnari]
MLGSPLATTSSSSQESLVTLTQPVGRNKQVKRKRDSSPGLLLLMEKSDARDEELLEQSRAMFQEVQETNAEFLRVYNLTALKEDEQNSQMLGLLDRMVKVMETNSKQ